MRCKTGVCFCSVAKLLSHNPQQSTKQYAAIVHQLHNNLKQSGELCQTEITEVGPSTSFQHLRKTPIKRLCVIGKYSIFNVHAYCASHPSKLRSPYRSQGSRSNPPGFASPSLGQTVESSPQSAPLAALTFLIDAFCRIECSFQQSNPTEKQHAKEKTT